MVSVSLVFLVATPLLLGQAVDYTRYVNVFRGTQNGGNMFPGVVPGTTTTHTHGQLSATLPEAI
jgi:hypothetical protein